MQTQQFAEDTTTQTLSPEERAKLIARVGSKYSQDRRTALERLQHRGVEGLDILLPLFHAEMRGQLRRRRFRNQMLRLCAGSMLLSYFVWIGIGNAFMHPEIWYALAVSGGIGLVSLSAVLITWRLSLTQRQTEIARSIAAIDDVRAIGPLIEALSYEGQQVAEVRSALIDLLKRACPADAARITKSQRDMLYRQLNNVVQNGEQVALAMSILAAIEQMGDANALPYVQQLAQRPGWTPGQRYVKTRAEECVEHWASIIAAAQGGTTLLRAADAPCDNAALLLRATTPETSAPPEQLLRATGSEQA